MKTLWIFKDRNGVRMGFHKPVWDKFTESWETEGVYEIDLLPKDSRSVSAKK
ncbi:MAG TPA: hypothetical protein PKY82_34965 [Pyrinomonadaceae bacterium]|nr:hypothetical protein [Pyrinomonadaceae bacterium]